MTVPSPPIDKVLTKKPSLGGFSNMLSSIPSLSSSSSATSGLNLSLGFNTAPVIGNGPNVGQPMQQNWMIYALIAGGFYLAYKEFK